MVQTIGVGHHAVVDRAQIKRGEVVAVIGAGPIGLGAASVAKAVGATVTIIDLMDNRLALASRLGIDHRSIPERKIWLREPLSSRTAEALTRSSNVSVAGRKRRLKML